MSHWSFVIAAYAVCIVATLALLLSAFAAMRRAEARVEELKRR